MAGRWDGVDIGVGILKGSRSERGPPLLLLHRLIVQMPNISVQPFVRNVLSRSTLSHMLAAKVEHSG